MKRYVIAAITCIALAVGVSPATASGGLGGVVETVTETTQQSTNTSGDASASNQNGTWQSNDQGQTGYGGDASTGDATTGGAECCGSAGDATSGDAYGGDVTQSQDASNTNSTSQEASAESKAVQTAPTNVYVPICLAKSCETGGVEQSNTNSSGDAWAGNANHTGQSNEQSQQGVGGDATTGDATTGGSGDATTGDAHGGDVDQSQTASNTNETSQNASAESKAYQTAPVNAYVPVCIAYRCDTGGVSQSNTNTSGDASASNQNGTRQSNEQSQKGYGGDASTGDATTGGGCCKYAKPECKQGSAYGKSYGKDGCYHGKPEKRRPSADAESGKAVGGDVDQRQQASNDNRTSQSASAESRTEQVGALNLILLSPPKPAPHGCKAC